MFSVRESLLFAWGIAAGALAIGTYVAAGHPGFGAFALSIALFLGAIIVALSASRLLARKIAPLGAFWVCESLSSTLQCCPHFFCRSWRRWVGPTREFSRGHLMFDAWPSPARLTTVTGWDSIVTG